MSLLLIGITLVIVLFAYFQFQLGYWKRKGIPGPAGSILLGNFWDLTDTMRPHVLVIRDWTKQFGKVFGILDGARKTLIVSDVDMLQEMFVKKFDYFYGRRNHALVGDLENDPRVHVFEAEGVRWKRLRTIAAPTFSSNSLKKIHGTVEDSAVELISLLGEKPEEPIDIHKFFQEYTMDVISRVALGQKESTLFNNDFVKYTQNIFGRTFRNPIFMLATVVPSLRIKLRHYFMRFARARKSQALPIFSAIYKAVDARISQREDDLQHGVEPGEPEDFIDLFLDAKDESVSDDSVEFSKSNVKISRSLTREEIVAQCFVFLLAGFDTTANALSYTCWLLSKSPKVVTKLQNELDEVWIDGESLPFEKLSKLKYLEAVMKEALRLYPLASFAQSRRCIKSTTLGDYTIDEGTYVMADTWTIQRSKQLWGDDAEDFNPDRWESSEVRHNLAWFPFGAGPRVCIGQRLAIMEEKLALAHLLRRFTIKEGPKTEKELKLIGSTTVSPASATVYLSKR